MANNISMTFGDVHDAAGVGDRTADELVASSDVANRIVTECQDEVEAMMTELNSAYQELQGQLDEVMATNRSRLHDAGWVGSSRETIVAHEAQLTEARGRFTESSMAALADFKAHVTNQLAEFGSQLQSDYTTAMTSMDESIRSATGAMRSTASAMEEIDNSITAG